MKARFLLFCGLALTTLVLAPGSRAQEEQKTPGQGTVPPELMIDNNDDPSKNTLGGRHSTYIRAPSRSAYSKADEYGKVGPGLKITYDLKNEGGPQGDGGFCGFYSIMKRGPEYLNATPYKYLVFWVKGEKGDEKFKIGVADKMQEQMDDSVKGQEVGAYLPAKRITTEWQQAVIPLDEWFVDWNMIAAISICFEHDVFDNGAGSGMVYIDEFMLTKERPADSSSPASKPAEKK
jgi:hypothetical protein